MLKPQSLSEAIFESIKFPLNKNLLIYNLLISLFASAFLYVTIVPIISQASNQAKEMQKISTSSSDISGRSIQEITDEIRAISQKGSNITEQEQEQLANDMKILMENNPLLQQLGNKKDSQDNKIFNPLLKKIPLFIFGSLLIGVFYSIRLLDIVCQIGTGNFVKPELHPMKYSKPFLWLKLFAFLFLWWMIIGIIFGIIIFIVMLMLPKFLAFLLIFIFYIAMILSMPAMIITFVTKYSIFGSLLPNQWLDTIKKLGIKKYFLVIVVLIIFSLIGGLINQIVNMLLFSNSGVIIGFALLVTTYIQSHIISAFHYLEGYLIYNNKHEFEMLGASDFALEATNRTAIQEAEYLVQDGHIGDAIEILKTAIKNEENFNEKLNQYKMLINLFQQENKIKLAEEMQDKMIKSVISESPSHINQISSLLIEKIKSKTYNPPADIIYGLAKTAFDSRNINNVFAITANFAKNNPNHKDIVPIYLIVGKSLCHAKQYEKANTLISGLYKKYQNHSQSKEIESLLKLIESQKSNI